MSDLEGAAMKLEPVAWRISRKDAPLPFIVLSESEKNYWASRSGTIAEPLYAIPPGYVLVPAEPTEAMIQAMVKAVYGPATFKVTPATVEMENVRDAYRAMIEGEQ